jgi:hypothetical protein
VGKRTEKGHSYDDAVASKTQSRAFCQDAYPMPIVGMAVFGLLLGDVAVVLAALAAIG